MDRTRPRCDSCIRDNISLDSGRSRSHALRCDRHALIMQMSLGLVRAAVLTSDARAFAFHRAEKHRVYAQTMTRVSTRVHAIPDQFFTRQSIFKLPSLRNDERDILNDTFFSFLHGNSIRTYHSLVERSLAGRHKGERSLLRYPHFRRFVYNPDTTRYTVGEEL